MTPADELAEAVKVLRSPHTTTVALARLRTSIADWLEHEAEIGRDDHLWTEREPCAWCGEPANAHALAVARALLGSRDRQEQP